MIKKIKQAIKVTGNMSRHIVPLCVLLCTGCMDDDFFTPEHPPYNRRVVPYKPTPPLRRRSPNDGFYNPKNRTNGRQDNNHNYGRSDHYAQRLETTPNNATTRNKPNHISQKDFEAGCPICLEENAYQDYGAMQCSKCEQFLCRPCYTTMLGKALEIHDHDYQNDLVFPYRIQFKCPFCNAPY